MKYFMIFGLFLGTIFWAKEASTEQITFEVSQAEAWKLTQVQLSFKKSSGEEILSEQLDWKLFFNGKDQSDELLYEQTSRPHKNCFRLKEAGNVTIQVFLAETNLLLEEYSFPIQPAKSDYLKRLATGSVAYQELGYVDWIEDWDTARKVAKERECIIVAAYFVGCGVSGGSARRTFLDPRFIQMSQKVVCVPVILGGPEDNTSHFYQVQSGLSFVLLNAEGIYLGTYFRPSPDRILGAIERASARNIELLNACETQRDIIEFYPPVDQIYALIEFGYYYHEQQAYEAAEEIYLQVLKHLGEYPNKRLKKYTLAALSYVYIALNRPDSVIQLVEESSAKSDLLLFALGWAYAKKAEGGSPMYQEQAQLYYEEIQASSPNATVLKTFEKLLKKLEK